MASLGDITATLVADIKDFEAKMDKAKSTLDGIQNTGKKTGKSLTTAFKDAERGSKMFLGTMTALGTAIGVYIGKATLTAARTETMGIAMEAVAKSTGVSTKVLKEQEEILKKQGITTQESRNILTRFMQSQLDVADASKIARVAQDLAVVAGEDSSAMTGRLTDAIATMNPMLLRQAGIVMNQGELFDTYAETLGKSGDELTQVEKKQAMVNIIMEEGKKVAGSYDMAMETAGKKMGSLKRYFEEAENTIGNVFLPTFGLLIDKVTEFMKQVTPEKVEAVFAKLNEWFPVIVALILGAALPAIVAMGGALWTAFAPLLPFIAAGVALGLILKSLGVDFTDVSAFIQDKFVPAIIKIWEWIQKTWLVIKDKWEEYGQPIFDMIVDFIEVTIIPAWEKLKESIKIAMEESGMEMEDFKKILKIVAIVIGGVLLGAVLGIIAALSGLMTVLAKVIEWSGELRNKTVENFKEIKEKIQWHVDKIKAIFKADSFKQGILKALKYPFEAFWHYITGLFDKIKNKIQDALDLTKRHSPSVIDRLKFGIKKAEKEINKLGSIELAPIGRVLTENYTGMSGGTGAMNLSINMSGANISSPEVAQEYAEQIGDAIIGKLRTNRRSYG